MRNIGFVFLLVTQVSYAQETIPVSITQTGGITSVETVYHLSDDGRYVVFSTGENNMVPNDTNTINQGPSQQGAAKDVFLLDQHSGEISRVSLRSDGGQIEDGNSTLLSISNDGKKILYMSEGNSQFPGDTLYAVDQDIYVYDVDAKTTTWLSVAPDGSEGNYPTLRGVLSGNGQYVAFVTAATNILPESSPYDSGSQVILMNSETKERELVTVSIDNQKPNGTITTNGLALSYDGRYAAFVSTATNITNDRVGGLFLRDMQTKTTELITKSPDGNPVFFQTIH